MAGDNLARNLSDQDQPQSSSEGFSDLKKAEAIVTRQRAAEQLTEEYQQEKGGMKFWDRIKANLTKASQISERIDEMKEREDRQEERVISQAEEEVLMEALDETLRQESESLKAVAERTQNRFLRLAERFPKIGRALQDPKVAAAVAVTSGAVGYAIYKGFQSAAISKGIRAATTAILSFNPFWGGVVGGAAGGALAGAFLARRRGQDQEYQAKAWQQEAELADLAKINSVEDAAQLSNEKLAEMTGVIENVLSERRLRGNLSDVLTLVTRHRLAQTVLVRREQGPIEANQSERIFQALERVEAATSQTDRLIINTASDRYQETYQEILGRKGERIQAKMWQGVLWGGSIGAVMGALAGAARPVEVQAQEPSIQQIAPDSDYFQQLETHYELSGRPYLDQTQIAESFNADGHVATQDLQLNDWAKAKENGYGWNTEEAVATHGNEVLHPNTEYIEHLHRIDAQNGSHYGFGTVALDPETNETIYQTDVKSLQEFIGKIFNNQLEGDDGAYRMAEIRNIDLRHYYTENGQSLTEFIQQHRDAFEALNWEGQKHIISNPENAEALLLGGVKKIAEDRANSIVRSTLIAGLLAGTGAAAYAKRAELGRLAQKAKEKFSGSIRGLNKRLGEQREKEED